MKKAISIKVNGAAHSIIADPSAPLLYVLRNELELNGPKYGCGLQQCGACMVLVDGKAQSSCMLPVSAIKDQNITTLEGLSKGDELHPVQEAFVTEQAAQCGYCLNGMVMATVSLLSEHPHPDDTQIRDGLQRNLCRCGTHSRIINAVKRASR